MKPIHFIIIGIAILILLFSIVWREKKLRDVEKTEQNKLLQGAVAVSTITAVVDPTTNTEYIISDIGENNLDGGVETRKMKVELAKVINDISTRTSVIPAQLTLRMYDPKMNLVGTTKIANPYQKTLPVGVPAQSTRNASGINYTCAGTGRPNGPAFYQNGQSVLFGMFCK